MFAFNRVKVKHTKDFLNKCIILTYNILVQMKLTFYSQKL